MSEHDEQKIIIKKCINCLVDKKLNMFFKKGTGYQSVCKSCAKIYALKYNKKNKAAISKNTSSYRKANKESIVKWKKDYYKKNKTKISIKHATYYKNNSEKIKQKTTNYYEENKLAIKIKYVEYRKENRHIKTNSNNIRRALKRKSNGKYSKEDIRKLIIRQDGLCATCKCGLFEVVYYLDHIIPLIKCGTNFFGNIQILCKQCNLRKQSMIPIKYRNNILKNMSEDELQIQIFQWAKLQKHPAFKLMFHTPNGGYRNKATAVKLKKMGVMAGVADIFLAYPSSGKSGLFIELKVGRNKPTDAQQYFLDCAINAGYQAEVCYGFDQAKHVIEEYLNE